ncbi:MAG TPA: hypothetical protein VFL83_21645 [Anaeromyxobacter sp.]|nr:hypothetical protein [Anaeromyxobacter sp.]
MYGSSLARTYYGAGDYNRRAAFTGRYYAAGGFFSSLKKLGSKIGNVAGMLPAAGLKLPGALGKGGLAKLAGKVGGKFLRGVPVLGTALTAFDIGKDLVGAFKPKAGAMTFSGLAGMQAEKGPSSSSRRSSSSSRRRRRAGGRRSAPRRSARRRRRSSYSRGDWGDPMGRDKKGHYLSRRGGHRNFRRRRRRRRGRGQRVSFTTKSGRRVSFTARGDDAT